MSSAHFTPGTGANLRLPRLPRYPPPRAAALPRCSAGGSPSYLDMWKKAMERDRKSQLLRQITLPPSAVEVEHSESQESLEKKTEVFNKILEVPKEERDRIQHLQVIDRAAAAIAAARALIKEAPVNKKKSDGLRSTEARSSGGTTEGRGKKGMERNWEERRKGRAVATAAEVGGEPLLLHGIFLLAAALARLLGKFEGSVGSLGKFEDRQDIIFTTGVMRENLSRFARLVLIIHSVLI